MCLVVGSVGSRIWLVELAIVLKQIPATHAPNSLSEKTLRIIAITSTVIK